jgi:hypothetical protein
MRPGGMVIKRCIDGELKIMFGKNVYLYSVKEKRGVVPELGQRAWGHRACT